MSLCGICQLLRECNANVVDKSLFMTYGLQLLCEMAESALAAQAFEYPICDNGVQKIARVTYDEAGEETVTYLTIARVATTVPVNFALVTYGPCPPE